MNRNLKTFLAIFFLICGVVGLVLGVVNFAQTPSATTSGTIYGAVGVLGLVLGALTLRKPKY